MTDLKAYSCIDYDYENSEIIFAKSNIVARKQFANNWCEGELGGINCKRVEWADEYYPSVPELVLVDHGWWVECSGCLQQISEDTISDEKLDPVDVNGSAWCSQKCYDGDVLERKKIKRMEAAGIRIMAVRLKRKIPQADVIYEGEIYRTKPHVYARRGNHGRLEFQQIVLWFNWPHQKIGPATYQMDKRREMPGIFVPNGDRERFEKWLGEIGVTKSKAQEPPLKIN